MSIEEYDFQHILQIMGFRENLKLELYHSGMLVKELAAQTGIKKHTIDTYLSVRDRMPAADVAVSLARAFGVSVEYLVTGSESAENRDTAHFSPEVRRIARIAEQLKPDYRKIALSLITTLKELENSKM